ncbi:hypothetical protein B0H14DRAFT_2587611 [Mycena olivaceomarginata]|nr:hypothetical protein B0H14DRAFT_2587611 [Mycena olivaceomarginata]
MVNATNCAVIGINADPAEKLALRGNRAKARPADILPTAEDDEIVGSTHIISMYWFDERPRTSNIRRIVTSRESSHEDTQNRSVELLEQQFNDYMDVVRPRQPHIGKRLFVSTSLILELGVFAAKTIRSGQKVEERLINYSCDPNGGLARRKS